MLEGDMASFEAQSQALRAELKTWETSWASSHDGKKPGRDDIKRNADIAQKYKQYNKIRDILSGKTKVPMPPPAKDAPSPTQKRRTEEDTTSQTPAKRRKHAETPSKSRPAPSSNVPLESTPSISRHLFSPAAPRSIGPTPQRDGRVLGLFDLMVERELGTPSRTNGVPSSPAVGKKASLAATPSKRKASEAGVGVAAAATADAEKRGPEGDEIEESAARMGRTPMSSGKRQMLDRFLTPLKRKDPNARGGEPQATPTSSSVSKLHFETPAFLKRHAAPPAPTDENGELAPAPLRLPRKPMGRGLSAIVASLRKIDEEEHDDDLDALREIEAGEGGQGRSAAPVGVGGAAAPSMPGMAEPSVGPEREETGKERGEPEVLAEDERARNLPLGGFDDEAMYDSPDEEQTGRDGRPLPVFKKKGQKRTTRRVNMKPVQVKRPSAAPSQQHTAEGEDADDVVPETQLNPRATDEDGAFEDQDPDDFVPSDLEASDDGAEDSRAAKRRKTTTKTAQANNDKKEGTVKKAARKVNEMAHANFRRLKLKNHGAKGGPGHNSRFRRRR